MSICERMCTNMENQTLNTFMVIVNTQMFSHNCIFCVFAELNPRIDIFKILDFIQKYISKNDSKRGEEGGRDL